MKKKKIRTQNTHEFRSSFILNMNKKEHKPRKFNHNNTNLKKKKIYRQDHDTNINFSCIFLYLEPNTNYQQKHP